jgi:phage tail tape-measure protein
VGQVKLMKRVLVSVAAALVAGCSSHPEPIVDTKGINLAAYQSDLVECQKYAAQINPAAGVAKGSVAGAAVGAAVGAIGGDVGQGAAVGAVSGGASSALKADEDKQNVVKRCLSGRGYKVLN